MSRVAPVSVEEAKGEVKEIYKTLEKKLGKVVNIFQNMGNSGVALKGFLGLSEAAEHTSISPSIRDKIALLVGQTNHCQYCLAAHTAISKAKGVSDKEIIDARHGEAADPKTNEILKFAKAVVENRGYISNQDVASLKAAGVNDQELVDLILIIMVNMYTNYFNLITDPKIDFPLAPELS